MSSAIDDGGCAMGIVQNGITASSVYFIFTIPRLRRFGVASDICSLYLVTCQSTFSQGGRDSMSGPAAV